MKLNMEKYKMALSWWMPLTLIPMISCFLYIYAGIYSKSKKLIYAAYAYSVPIILIGVGFETYEISGVIMGVWVISIAHTFFIRRKYVERCLEIKEIGIGKVNSVEYESKKGSHSKKRSTAIVVAGEKSINNNYDSNANLNENISVKNIKWYKLYDVVIWIGLAMVIIGCTFFSDMSRGYSYNFDKTPIGYDVKNIEDVMKVTDEIIKRDYGSEYKLEGLRGECNFAESIKSREPLVSMIYSKSMLGNTRKRIVEIEVDTLDDKITMIHSNNRSVYGENEKFQYDPNTLDLNEIYDLVYDNVDMETVLKGYDPSISFYTYGNEMSIYVAYYKVKKNTGVDYNSKVTYNFTIDIRSNEIKSQSVEGSSN